MERGSRESSIGFRAEESAFTSFPEGAGEKGAKSRVVVMELGLRRAHLGSFRPGPQSSLPTAPDPYLGKMVKVGQFSQARIVFDARYSPLLITTFFGKCDLEAAKWQTDLISQATIQAARRGQRVITISDATHSDKPTAEARKFWADNMSTGSASVQAATLGTYVVFTSAVVRGALTAIGWLNPEVKKIETFGRLSDAIQAALLRLKKERLHAPDLDPNGYQLPHEDSSHVVSQ